MATLVYRYGLLTPTLEADEVWAQMRAAHRYRNNLTEIERLRRAAIRLAEQESDPSLAGAQAALAWLEHEAESLAKEAKKQRSSTRKRGITSDIRSRLVETRDLVKRAKVAIRLYRALVVIPALQNARDEINTRTTELRRNARGYRPRGLRQPLVHGTYSLVEEADAASRSKLPLYEDPQFRRWTGEGQVVDGELSPGAYAEGAVGVQIQGGAKAEEVVLFDESDRGHTFVQILPSKGPHPMYQKARRDGKPRREGRGARQTRILRLRVGSNPDRSPVWAEWHMQMHRPLPEGAQIMRVAAHCRRIGPRDEWYATITVRVPDEPRRKGDRIAVAVDVGWRMLPDGSVRVAYWRGEDGRHDQFVLTARQLEGLTKADSIRAIRDRAQNTMSAGVAKFLADTKTPPWLTEATHGFHLWKSHKRFYRLRDQWSLNRFAGDEVAFALLDSWVGRDRHLWEYEAGQRIGAARNRKDWFRRFAAWLAAQYDCVVLEKKFIQRAKFHARKATEDGAMTEDTGLRRLQSLAAPSSLGDTLKSAFHRLGDPLPRGGSTAIVELRPAFTTRNCHKADGGEVDADDAAEDVVARYSCGCSHDQDDNACQNLLALYRERLGDPPNRATARVKDSEDRRARSRRMRAEREARMATAREKEENAAK